MQHCNILDDTKYNTKDVCKWHYLDFSRFLISENQWNTVFAEVFNFRFKFRKVILDSSYCRFLASFTLLLWLGNLKLRPQTRFAGCAKLKRPVWNSIIIISSRNHSSKTLKSLSTVDESNQNFSDLKGIQRLLHIFNFNSELFSKSSLEPRIFMLQMNLIYRLIVFERFHQMLEETMYFDIVIICAGIF